MLAAAEKIMKLRETNPFFLCITSWYQMTSGYPLHLWSEKIWDSAVRWYPTCASGFTAAVVCAAAPGFETGGL